MLTVSGILSVSLSVSSSLPLSLYLYLRSLLIIEGYRHELSEYVWLMVIGVCVASQQCY